MSTSTNVDCVLLGLFASFLLQLALGGLRMILVENCEHWIGNLNCYILTLQSNSNVMWYLFLNLLSFHIVRLLLSHKLASSVTSFFFVHNLYLGILLYYVFSMLHVDLK